MCNEPTTDRPSDVALAMQIAATIAAAAPPDTRCAFRIASAMGVPAVVLPDCDPPNACYFSELPHPSFRRLTGCADATELVIVYAAPGADTEAVQAEVLAGLVMREARRVGRSLPEDAIDTAVSLILAALEREVSR
ncbi:hypothetical protein [Sandaracinus amylolyticus]|uniref:hypothetical protein n=1 Tax=Sandaracinus amylolyticus TaxID=927083 RepID=UPI001F3383DC|nr:hypothetical protein [Sandaracinus amylolyticus]UJR79844.1 Hypothetical protein I5071_18830 [Sandaracinus amylolyticus]